MTAKIGVFPASGGLGTSIINHLVQLVPTSQLVLIARHPEKLTELSRLGATVRRADYDEPDTLERAFDGVDVLMLISYASFEIEHRVQAHKKAINAAHNSTVRQIFYSSLAYAGDAKLTTSRAHVMGAHLATESYLASSLVGDNRSTYTAIREGLYSESFPIYTGWFDLKNPGDEVTIPHDGRWPGVAWAKRDELGEATAKMIVAYTQNPRGFAYLNRVVLLSGSKEMSLGETVAALGRVVGKDVRIREISVEEYARLPQVGTKHTYHGVELSREWATAWEAIRQGETAVVNGVLEGILGREPEGFERTVEKLYRST